MVHGGQDWPLPVNTTYPQSMEGDRDVMSLALVGLNCRAAAPSPNAAVSLWDGRPPLQGLPTMLLSPTRPQVPALGWNNQLPPFCMPGEEVPRSSNKELTPTINRSHEQAPS